MNQLPGINGISGIDTADDIDTIVAPYKPSGNIKIAELGGSPISHLDLLQRIRSCQHFSPNTGGGS